MEGTARSVPKAGRDAAESPVRKLGRGPAAPCVVRLGNGNTSRNQEVEDPSRRRNTRLERKPAESRANPIAERAASPSGHTGRNKPQFSRRGTHRGSQKPWPRPSPGQTNNKGQTTQPLREPRARGEKQRLLGAKRPVRWPQRTKPTSTGASEGESPRPEPPYRPQREPSRWLRSGEPKPSRHVKFQILPPGERVGQPTTAEKRRRVRQSKISFGTARPVGVDDSAR